MFEVGVGPHSVAGFGPPGKPLGRVMAETAEAGYDHFMFLAWELNPPADDRGDAPDSFCDLKGSDLRALVRRLAQHGVRASSIFPGFMPVFERTELPQVIERLKAYREIAWELGCHTMVIPAGASPKPHMPTAAKLEGIGMLAEVMDAVASDEPGAVFKVAVDVHYHANIETVEDCDHLLDTLRVRNAGICLNIGHLHTVRSPGWELLRRRPDRIHVVAWKDHGENLEPDAPHPYLSKELGTGDTPLQEYVDAYLDGDCRGIHMITVEHVPFEDRVACLRRSREHLFRLFREAIDQRRSGRAS
jgi:sugar phosphate isomerase/epimerase